jgi:HEAT repeat protein
MTPREAIHAKEKTMFRKQTLTVTVILAALTVGLTGAALAQSDAEDRMIDGHVALDRVQYRTAAEQFRQAAALAEAERLEREQAEALYWRAFALHRLGGRRDLNDAAESLLALRALEMEEKLHQESLALAAQVKADLAQQGDAQAARELAEMAEEQDNLEEKLIALQALMHMNPDRALPILEQILENRDPGTVELRRQAVFLLSHGGAEGSEALMIDVAQNDPDPEVRSQAIFWLGQTGSPEALQFFRQLLANDPDPEVLEHTLFALSQFDGEEANQILRDLAADPAQPLELRQQAIFGLGHQGDADDRRFLRELYPSLEDPELKEHILHAAAQEDDPATAEWLVAIALDEDEDLESRKMALFWAGQQGLLPVSRLTELYTSVDDQQMREQIIFVLSQDGGQEAMQVLMDIARQETDPELRKQAIFWIGQSGADGAEAFLLEIINQ